MEGPEVAHNYTARLFSIQAKSSSRNAEATRGTPRLGAAATLRVPCGGGKMPLSATAWKRTETGKMKMVRFSGIKFAAGLAYETLNPLPSHEIRRTRIRRQIFSTNAKKKIVHFQIAGIDAVLGRR
jgi:hypothetical protein